MPRAVPEPRSRPAEVVVRQAKARLARCLGALNECLEFGHPTHYVRALIRDAEFRLALLGAVPRSGNEPPAAMGSGNIPHR